MKGNGQPASPVRDSPAYEPERREDEFARWVEYGSDDMRKAWVSVCSHAKTHDVEHVPLTRIVACIAGDATLSVTRAKASGETWRHAVDLVGLTERIRELFEAGVTAARRINAKTFARLLNEIGLKANPEDVEPVVTQPKKSEKVFYLTAIRVNGAEYPVEKRIVYEDPETLGKRKCEDTKRQLPGVLFAGLFDPSRDKDFFRRHTELYPLDADHVADPASLRCRVSKHPSVFAAFLSATGSGLRILVRGPRVTDKDDYDDVYMRILRTLGMEWGISDKLDATRDCSRLSFLSYDPDLYINWDAVPLALDDLSEPEPEPEQAKANAKGKASETNERKPKPEPKPAGLGAPLAIDWGEAGGIPDAIWEDISLKKCCDALC